MQELPRAIQPGQSQRMATGLIDAAGVSSARHFGEAGGFISATVSAGMSAPPVGQIVEVGEMERRFVWPIRESQHPAQACGRSNCGCSAWVALGLPVIVAGHDQQGLRVLALQCSASLQQIAGIHGAGHGFAGCFVKRGPGCPAFAQVQRLAGADSSQRGTCAAYLAA